MLKVWIFGIFVSYALAAPGGLIAPVAPVLAASPAVAVAHHPVSIATSYSNTYRAPVVRTAHLVAAAPVIAGPAIIKTVPIVHAPVIASAAATVIKTEPVLAVKAAPLVHTVPLIASPAIVKTPIALVH